MLKAKILMLFVLAFIAISACKKDPNKGLSPETQTGANTFSCKINGLIFVPKVSLFGGTPLFAQLDTFNSNQILLIIAKNENTYITNMDFNIYDFKGVGIYPIDVPNGVFVDCYLNIPHPNLEKSKNGVIRITKYDGKIVSGTFEFNLSHGTENIAVTLGRFDLTLRGVK
jgi:hypothetical protein